MKKFFNRGAIKKKSGGDDTNHQDGDLSNSSQQQQQIVTPPDVQLRIQPDRIQSEPQHEGQRRQPLHKSDYPPQQLPKEAKQYLSNNYSSSGPAIVSIGANTGGFVQEAPGLPGEDRNGIERLTGESDEQYVARQTHLREEARARMVAKFGSGGLSGNNSTSSAPTSSNSGLMIGRSGSGGSAPSPSPFTNNNANTTSYGGLQEAVGMPGEDRNGIERLTGESDEQYVMRQTRLREEARARMAAKFGGGGLSSASSSSSGGVPPPAPSSSNYNQTTPNRVKASMNGNRSAPSSGNSLDFGNRSKPTPPKQPMNTTDFFSSFGA